jgi:hypothetical protein
MPIISKFYNFDGQPHSGQALMECGPVLPVEVLIEKVSIKGLALIDTGARLTCVHGAALIGLDVKPIGVIDVLTAAGAAQQPMFAATLRFGDENLEVDFGQIVGADLSDYRIPVAGQPNGMNVIALIGRDALSNITMTYHGHLGLVTLAH